MLVPGCSCNLTSKDWNMAESETSQARKLADVTRRSNFDRLRGHLKEGSLAGRLLDAWLAGDAEDAVGRMRAVLDAPVANETEAHASSPQA